jgi:hypothetical protein
VLLVFGAPSQLPSLAGLEHGRTIPLAVVSALTLSPLPALANHGDDNSGHPPSHVAAPAPLIGVSLPGLAIGFGVFWLIRHRARRNN